MDKIEMGITIMLYIPIVIVAICRARTFCMCLEFIGDMKRECGRQFLYLFVEGLLCYGCYRMGLLNMWGPGILGDIGRYILSYGVAYHLLCWIITLVCLSRDAEEERERPKVQKGIGTDPNSPNLSAEDFRYYAEHGEWMEEENEKDKKKKKAYKPERW